MRWRTSPAADFPGISNRALPNHLDAVIDPGTWEIPTVFTALEDAGSVARDEMFRVFNMGVGMVVIAASRRCRRDHRQRPRCRCVGWVMGEVKAGNGEVVIA